MWKLCTVMMFLYGDFGRKSEVMEGHMEGKCRGMRMILKWDVQN
jgi:hypothetical protein